MKFLVVLKLLSLNFSQFVAHQYWLRRCASPHRFRDNLVKREAMVMEPTDVRYRDHSAPGTREDGAGFRTLHRERHLRPPPVILGKRAGQDMRQTTTLASTMSTQGYGRTPYATATRRRRRSAVCGPSASHSRKYRRLSGTSAVGTGGRAWPLMRMSAVCGSIAMCGLA